MHPYSKNSMLFYLLAYVPVSVPKCCIYMFLSFVRSYVLYCIAINTHVTMLLYDFSWNICIWPDCVLRCCLSNAYLHLCSSMTSIVATQTSFNLQILIPPSILILAEIPFWIIWKITAWKLCVRQVDLVRSTIYAVVIRCFKKFLLEWRVGLFWCFSHK